MAVSTTCRTFSRLLSGCGRLQVLIYSTTLGIFYVLFERDILFAGSFDGVDVIIIDVAADGAIFNVVIVGELLNGEILVAEAFDGGGEFAVLGLGRWRLSG